MKKRLLSALLALALVFVLLPTTALASSIDPDITIAGTEYDFELENYKENTYKTVYYQHDKFLTKFEYTSDGVWATDPYLELTKTGAGNATTITITVHKGSNTTKAFEIKSAETCIATSSSYWNLVITGSGALSLTHTGTSAAIWSNHSNITITGGVTVNVKGTKSGSNINSYSNAIQCGETFTVSNGATVVAENNSTYSNGPAVKTEKFTISGDAKFEAKSAYGGKAISFDSITADGYDFMGRSGNSGSYTTLTGDDKATKLQEYSSIQITPTPTPALEKSNVYVAGTNLYKNTAYTIQNGKPVMGGTYPGNYNIYFDATDYVLHVKDANIDARGTTGIYGTSDIVFVGVNSITASTYGIYSYFKSSDLKISGTGSLNVKTIAGDPAIATAYDTSRSIIISGNGFTVTADTSETTSYAIRSAKDLTITDGAAVIAKSNEKRAIDIDGDLTVTGATLTATSNSNNVPTVQVGGDATFTGSTVTITNNSTALHKDAAGSTKGDSVSSALYVKGNINTDNANVTAKVENGGGNAIGALGNITVNGSTVTAVNKGQKFTTIIAENVYVSGDSKITANNLNENPVYNGSYLAFPAIEGNIVNQNTDYSLKFKGQHNGTSEPKTTLAPGEQATLSYYNVTITRGDAYTTPQVAANYTIAGQTMYVGKYYKTDANGYITDGTAQDYNIYCDSENDFTLNNATISSTGKGGSTGVIKTNLSYSSAQFHIKLIGTNSINNAGHHAILGEGAYSTIIIENAENASNASLTISGNFLPVYSFGNVTINAEVVIKNTNGNLISTNKDGHANGAFDLGSGYKCYASTSTTGNLLEEFNSANYSTYKYLRVTTLTLETGGGSTHQHVWDEAWHDTGDYHHAHQCTICKAYDTTTQELHNVTGHRDNHDGSHSNICGSCGYSAKVSHSYTWAPNANDNEKHIGTCVCGNVVEKNHNFVGDVCSDCGYDKSTGTTCEHVWTTEWTIDTVDNEYHWHKCIKCNAITDKKPHAYTIVTDSGTNHIRECECKVFYVEDHISSDWIIDTPATATTAGSMHKECTVCKHKMQTEVIPATGEIEPPTPDNPGTIVIIRPAEEEKPAQQPNPSTGANDLVGLAVTAAGAAALGSAALLRKHD